MDEREQKGLVIAAMSKIEKRGAETWIVPSQSQKGKYAVTITAEGKACTCPDFEERQLPCKHVMAVQFVLFREQTTETKPDGTVTTTTTETKAVKVTYAQPSWNAYNAAQTTEGDHFRKLLHDLVADVPTQEQVGSGNRRVPMPDLLFGAAMKVYSGFSARRGMSDLRAARDNGHVGTLPSYNAILDAMKSETLTPILHELITATAKPLASVESQFAVDSTGIGTQNFYRHYSAKYGKGHQDRREHVKLHALVGTKTNIIAACKITDRENDHGDTTEFKPLVEQAAQDFDMKEISADLAYSTYDNLLLAESVGAAPFIPFKTTAVAVSRSKGRKAPAIWTRLYHYFQLNREEFLEHYHRRSAVECTFSMLKRCIGDTLRSKTPTAQQNEALLMVICHNIRVLVHEMHELGINPTLRGSVGQVSLAGGSVG